MDTKRKHQTTQGKDVDYSAVTPATGDDMCDKPIPGSLANNMPYADSVAVAGTVRTDPDKVIPGNESPTGVDELEQEAPEI